MSESIEPCPKCGNITYAVARDMYATRHCRCGHTWWPQPKIAGAITIDPNLLREIVREIVREEIAQIEFVPIAPPLPREELEAQILRSLAELPRPRLGG